VEDPLVPLLDSPRDYEIVQMLLRLGDVREPFIELTVARTSLRKRFRFGGPRVLQINPGFEAAPRGLEVRDISARNIGALRYRVEAAGGALSFWARSVQERTLSEVEAQQVRTRPLRPANELREILERGDPRLSHRLEWLSRREAAAVKSYAELQPRASGAAARYFVISTK
jgi:hypothetical protein